MARLSPVTGHYVTIDVMGGEYKVFFLENGSGRPLVCQHTAGCHNHQWRDLLEDEDITSRYRVIAYDLARHGKSDPPHNVEWWSLSIGGIIRRIPRWRWRWPASSALVVRRYAAGWCRPMSMPAPAQGPAPMSRPRSSG